MVRVKGCEFVMILYCVLLDPLQNMSHMETCELPAFFKPKCRESIGLCEITPLTVIFKGQNR